MSEINQGYELMPQQSADVIRYYNDGENAECRRNGWKDKIAIGRSAIHSTRREHSILPTGEPVLTASEVRQGLDIIYPPKKLKTLSEEELDACVDKRGMSYEDALRMFEADG